MELRPINNTDTFTFINKTKVVSKEIDKKVVQDPKLAIPNGIYGVIRWEKLRQVFTILLSGAFLITTTVLIMLDSLFWKAGWLAYILPIGLGLLSLQRLALTSLEFIELKRSVIKYRADIAIGLESTPPFIAKLYIKLYKKQVSHNWITFSLLFYVGIFTLLLWWLKDSSWFIFQFDVWIKNSFGNPDIIAMLLAISLAIISIIHIIFAIQRKRKIVEINSYFGSELATEIELDNLRARYNKAYRRLFIISILIILVIPILIKASLKLFKRKIIK